MWPDARNPNRRRIPDFHHSLSLRSGISIMGPLTRSRPSEIPVALLPGFAGALPGSKLITGKNRLMKAPPAMDRSGDSSCCYARNPDANTGTSGGGSCRGKNAHPVTILGIAGLLGAGQGSACCWLLRKGNKDPEASAASPRAYWQSAQRLRWGSRVRDGGKRGASGSPESR